MVHSQVALIVSDFKCFNNSFFCAFFQQRQVLLNVLRHADSTIVMLPMILSLFQYVIYTCCGSSKMLFRTQNFSSVPGFKSSIKKECRDDVASF